MKRSKLPAILALLLMHFANPVFANDVSYHLTIAEETLYITGKDRKGMTIDGFSNQT